VKSSTLEHVPLLCHREEVSSSLSQQEEHSEVVVFVVVVVVRLFQNKLPISSEGGILLVASDGEVGGTCSVDSLRMPEKKLEKK